MPTELAPDLRLTQTVEPSRSPSALSVRGARREYASGKGLRGVDLDVASGELCVLLGPNGAGKTSLIRAICGRLALTSGNVFIDGRDPRQDRTARTRLGVVPQAVALYDDLTARENLELFGRLSGIAAADLDKAVDAALDWAGLSSRSTSLVKTLSGGMKRRLNLVAGTLHRPSLLLLDEPTVGVDPEARERLHDLLKDLKERGIAILLTTHDLDQAAVLADRVAILADGAVLARGSVDAVVESVLGTTRQLIVRLAEPARPDQRTVLSRLGLESKKDPSSWTSRLDGSIDSLGTLDADLKRHGVPVIEMRVREPSLRGAYFRLVEEGKSA